MQEVDNFVSRLNNKLINNGGTQCVALANQYESDVVKGGWIGTPLTGYANDWWTNYQNAGNEKSNYDQIPVNQTPQKGDLTVWTKLGSLPHIALVLMDKGNVINTFTQHYPATNATVADLPKSGLAGYVRPKRFANSVVTASASNVTVAGQTQMVRITGDYRTFYDAPGGNALTKLLPNRLGGGHLDYKVLATQGDYVKIERQDESGQGWIYVGTNGGANTLTQFFNA